MKGLAQQEVTNQIRSSTSFYNKEGTKITTETGAGQWGSSLGIRLSDIWNRTRCLYG